MTTYVPVNEPVIRVSVDAHWLLVSCLLAFRWPAN